MIAKFVKTSTEIEIKNGTSINGLKTEDTSLWFGFEASIISKNKIICQIKSYQKEETRDTEIKFADETFIYKKFNHKNNITQNISTLQAFSKAIKEKSFNPMLDTFIPKLCDVNNNEVAVFGRELVTAEKAIDNYTFNKITFKNELFKVYSVGNYKDGVFQSVYDSNDQIVGMIKMGEFAKNFKSHYDIYCKDEKYAKLMCIITFIWNDREFETKTKGETHGGYSIAGKKVWSKLLNAKFDPTYIESVKRLESPENYIENMPLVKEMLKEAQHSKQARTSRIVSIIMFIVFLLILFIPVIIGLIKG